MQFSSIKRFSALTLASLSATVMLGSLSPAVEARPTTNAVIRDANEAVVDGKDFKQMQVQVSGDKVIVTLQTYDDWDFNGASMYFTGGDNQQVHLPLSANSFRVLGQAPGQPGFFNVPLAEGNARTTGNTYKFSFSWSDAFGNAQEVTAWTFSQDGGDRIPNLPTQGMTVKRPATEDAKQLQRFLLRFNDAYLVHVPNTSTLQIAAQSNVLSYGQDWQVQRLKPYLYHFRQNNWQDFYWAVNTSRGEVYRVRGGTFGNLGGQKEKLDIGVDSVGNANNPDRFFLRFSDAYLVKANTGALQIAAQGNVLSYGSDWEVQKLKPYLFQLRQNNWQNFRWQVNTSRESAQRISGGAFGSLSGQRSDLDVQVEAVYQ